MSDFLGDLFNASSGSSVTDAAIGSESFDARCHVNHEDVGFRSVIAFGTIPNTIHAIVVPSVVEQAIPYTDWHPALDPKEKIYAGVLCYGNSATVVSSLWEERKLYFQWVRSTWANSNNGSSGFEIIRDGTNPTVSHGSGLDASIGVNNVSNLLGGFVASDVNGVADAAIITAGGGFGGDYRHLYRLASNNVTGVFTGVNNILHFGSTSPASTGHMQSTYGNYRNPAYNPTPIETSYWDGSETSGIGGNNINPHLYWAGQILSQIGLGLREPRIYNGLTIDSSISGITINSNTPGVVSISWSGGSILTPAGSPLFGIHWDERPENAVFGFGNRALRPSAANSLEAMFHASPALIESLPHGKEIHFGLSIDRYLSPTALPMLPALGWPTDPLNATISVTVMSSP